MYHDDCIGELIAVEAMKRGAYDFLPKPVNLDQLEYLIKRGLKDRNLEQKINISIKD